MLRLPIVLLFVGLTFLSWGLYGPVLHIGQVTMDHSRLRPFICVGVAYFLIAVLVPALLLRRDEKEGFWTVGGAIWSFLAGAVGAAGALGIIVAFEARGKPVYVMPLVFGCAPVVNTLVTMWMTKTVKQAGTIFCVGILLVALGAAGVLVFKPQPSLSGSSPQSSAAAADSPLLARELFTIIAAIAVTALCWGSYGPMLHKGQIRMAGSRLRPFLCVGLAYFALAVILPIGILLGCRETGHWSFAGSLWSLGAGAFGALGALGIIMAFNFGGKPIYVMPLVFGGAPVINTLTSIVRSVIQTGSPGFFPWLFLPSLVLVIVGAVLVLVFSPKSRHEPGPEIPQPRPRKREKPQTRTQQPALPETPPAKPPMPPVADDLATEPEAQKEGSTDATSGQQPTAQPRADDDASE